MKSSFLTDAPASISLGTLPRRIALAVAATAFVALCAHIAIPLGFTPVPFTLQPFAVILVGLALGPVTAFSAMMLYLAEGAAGLPVFTPQGLGGIAQLLGPTAGFLFAYPLAAAAAGAIARLATSFRSRFPLAVLGGTVATAILFALGASWLAHILHLGPAAALRLAVLPFLPGEAIKILAAAGIFSALAPSNRI